MYVSNKKAFSQAQREKERQESEKATPPFLPAQREPQLTVHAVHSAAHMEDKGSEQFSLLLF